MRLTENQIWVIEELKRQQCFWLASATQQAWFAGKAYYIDDRVNVKGVRRRFNQGNKEATT